VLLLLAPFDCCAQLSSLRVCRCLLLLQPHQEWRGNRPLLLCRSYHGCCCYPLGCLWLLLLLLPLLHGLRGKTKEHGVMLLWQSSMLGAFH
jgi:hypothetical protein